MTDHQILNPPLHRSGEVGEVRESSADVSLEFEFGRLLRGLVYAAEKEEMTVIFLVCVGI